MKKTQKQKERRVVRSIAFPESLSKTIRDLAEREQRSVNQTIERLVVAGLRELAQQDGLAA